MNACIRVRIVAASGGDIEHFSHDLLLCSLFMLHFKGLSVIINSRPKQNECVSRTGVWWRGAVGLSVGWVAATARGIFGTLPLLLYGFVGASCSYMCVYSQERDELRRDFTSPVMILGAKY